MKPFRTLLRPLAAAGRRSAAAARRAPLAAIGVAALAGVVVLALVATLGATPVTAPPATAAGPAFTYAGTWSLIDLQRHIDAGEVVAITAGGSIAAGAADAAGTGNRTAVANPDSDVLAARLTSGQVVRIGLTVSPGDAVLALAGLGHGNLLTQEAWKVARAQVSGSAPAAPADPARSLISLLLPMLVVAVLLTVVFRFARRATAGGGQSKGTFTTIMPTTPAPGAQSATEPTAGATTPTSGRPAVSLADVAGCAEAKTELTETIEFLQSPEKFHKLGARIPRGIMLYGPPGTGKTMLARAVAAEAGVPFHYASGSEFVEKYVGVGAKRIRDLFAQARKHGRGVIFFDEFDALGKARGGANSHEEREQTLNQLLVELDGFGTTEDVIVIAATNRIDILDPAVLRPGRFNRKIHVGLPDVLGRREILEVHSKNKPLTVATDLESVARKTYGFSGAQLADLLNEAAILAARRGGDAITPEDLHDGWLKVAVGTSRRRSMDERERSIIAAHEVGHAICGKVHGDKRRVEEISLFAHGEALGVTVSSQEDNDLPAESDLRARLVALMGGRAAEELLFQEVTGGASNDFEKANEIATTMVTKWGMGRDPDAAADSLGTSGRGSLGFLVAGGSERLPGEVEAAATRAVRAILDDAYAQACATLVDRIETVRRLAAYLVEHERVDGETFDGLFEGTTEVAGAAGEWRPAGARPRAWNEIVAYAAGRRKAALGPVGRPARPESLLGSSPAVSTEPTADVPNRLPEAPGEDSPDHGDEWALASDHGDGWPLPPDRGAGAGTPARSGEPIGAGRDRDADSGHPGDDGREGRARRPIVVGGQLGRVAGKAAGRAARRAAGRAAGDSGRRAGGIGGRRLVRRAGVGRRVRGLAAGALHRAETWLVPADPEVGPS